LHLARPRSDRWHDEAGSVDEVSDWTSKTSTMTQRFAFHLAFAFFAFFAFFDMLPS